MWEYTEKVMDHYRHPRNVGSIDNADAVGTAGSLVCGDQLKIYLKIENKDDRIEEIMGKILGGSRC